MARGTRRTTNYGGDLRNAGGTAVSEQRLRPDGTIVNRNDFVGNPIHRVDMRMQKRIGLGGNRSIAGVFEVFNLFNHENYGHLHDAGEQRELRTAVIQQQPGLPGADAAARLPVRLLVGSPQPGCGSRSATVGAATRVREKNGPEA